jgi:hypothetical protein
MAVVRIASALSGLPKPGELICVSKNGPVYRVVEVLTAYEVILEDRSGRKIRRHNPVWYDPLKLINWYHKRSKMLTEQYDAFLA